MFNLDVSDSPCSTSVPERAHLERWRDRPCEAAATELIRCQCLSMSLAEGGVPARGALRARNKREEEESYEVLYLPGSVVVVSC